MQAELEVTPPRKSFYQRHIKPALRRLLWPRRPSFWNVSLEDELGDGSLGAGIETTMERIVRTVLGTVILLVGQAVLILAPIAIVVQLVFVTPGGLPGVIGHQLADVCVSGGSCDLGQLLASYAFAVIILVSMIGLLGYGMLSSVGYFDQPNPDDVLLALGVIDERVRELRLELIAAGVLPDPPDEEADDDQ